MPGETLAVYRRYLGDLVRATTGSVGGDGALDAALARFPLDEAYVPAGVDEPTRAFIEGLHVFNVWRVLGEGQAAAPTAGP